uniref:Uncharacterized protein n=1 Tax=Picea glauca TaxID=3330 RepID=A0A101M3Q5_PICGL|nr:hypothetical protein ABT39_MTgene367 [Picea glauca]
MTELSLCIYRVTHLSLVVNILERILLKCIYNNRTFQSFTLCVRLQEQGPVRVVVLLKMGYITLPFTIFS